jgi:beta-lactamase regulating signal transducer with metallopeptidase domain
METIFVYFIKSSALIALFFLVHYLFLRKETFFTFNRWYLLMGLAISVSLPLYFIKKIVYVKPIPTVEQNSVPAVDAISMVQSIPQTAETDWFQIGFWVYGIVALGIVIKVLYDLLSLYRILTHRKAYQQEDCLFIDIEEDIAPFSFFQYIVFNSKLYTDSELESIITHEKVHSTEKHSYDVLVAKLFAVVFWFNPFIYFYKKAILQNLEYIADEKAIGILNDKKSYQMTLLKVVSNQNCLSITNNFNQSLIKKRIVMLNKNQSHRNNLWKFALVVPALIAFVFLFQVKTIAQEKQEKSEETSFGVSTSYSSILTKDSSNDELKELEKTFSNEDQKLFISNVKRNGKGEIIEIKLVFDTGKPYVQVLARKSNNPISDIKIYVDTDKNNKTTCGFVEIDLIATEAVVVEDSAEESKSVDNYWSMDNMKKNGKEVVLIINGKVNGPNEKVKLPVNEELGKMKEITPSEFEKKYNQKADANKYYFEASTVKTPVKGVNYNEAVNLIALKNLDANKEKNILCIINGKEYFSNSLKNYTLKCSGSIKEMGEKEALETYGEKGKDGVWIFNGTTTFEEKTPTSQENQKPKLIVFPNDDGDDVVIMDNYKVFKVVGNPPVQLTSSSPVLIINGKVQSNPKATLEAMNVNQIKSVRVYDENDKETKGTAIKKIVITTK